MTTTRRRWIGLLAGLAVLVLAGCSSDQETTPTSVPEDRVADGPGYELELVSSGTGDRFPLVAAVPVGHQADVVVRLNSQGESVDVGLVAEVVRADAGGAGQDVELTIVSIDADDPTAVAGLAPIIDASSVVRRDERRAVVEQRLDLPDGLGFRADAVARQALRAPFSLAGPVAAVPVGAGARWTVTALTDGEVTGRHEVVVDTVGPDRYRLRFELADGPVEIVGHPEALLPAQQIVELGDATLTVIAAPLR